MKLLFSLGGKIKLCGLALSERSGVGLSLRRWRKTWDWHWVIDLSIFRSASSAMVSTLGSHWHTWPWWLEGCGEEDWEMLPFALFINC